MRKLTSLLLLFCFSISNAQTVGLLQYTVPNSDGYVLFSPLFSTQAYLIDKCGQLVHQWASTYQPGQACYLLSDGSLLRTGNANNATFNSG
ncbi:MAG: hypothetical protein LH473_11450, partial [Chitinophagales bacterium]|nr:hypothetical protein [Chitinophagales bacterium]